MIVMSDDDIRPFQLKWTIAGPQGGKVGFEITGTFGLYNGNRGYRIDGRLRIVEGEAYYQEIGNPKLFVRRNGGEESGRQWGWQPITGKKACDRLCVMEMFFVRTGYWAPADRSLLLDIGAHHRWSRRTEFSPAVEVRMVD
ncbi:hypothetical protein EWH70_29425 [Amycolatopsis suaedae]|uniref:Uncharacterized protein n=2 Tax=Amycolatopsis suaedae TaxID=2510978 RepID=A0A4Q7IZF0_9PSEU|nr:hypothetical protein EWH70_29425 [Amycolatopsis suaedae]